VAEVPPCCPCPPWLIQTRMPKCGVSNSPPSRCGGLRVRPSRAAVFLLRSDDPQAEPYVSKTANLRPPPATPPRPSGTNPETEPARPRTLHRIHSHRLRLRIRVSPVSHAAPQFPENLHRPPAPALRPTAQSCTSKTNILAPRSPHAWTPGRTLSLLWAVPIAHRSRKVLPTTRSISSRCGAASTTSILTLISRLHLFRNEMCLAPCFKGCSDAEYQVEVGKVQAYFDSGGDSLVRRSPGSATRLRQALILRTPPP